MGFEDDLKAVVKDGADITGILAQVEGMNPLNGLKTKEDAFELIKNSPLLISAHDAAVGRSVENGVENFKNGKMKDLLKAREEEIRKELLPQETEAAKVAREFNEYKQSVEVEKAMSELKDKLSEKAKELNFPDPLLIRDFAGLGENAEAFAEKYIGLFDKMVTDRVSEEVKGKYAQKQPNQSKITPADIDTRIREARAAGRSEEALKLQMLKQTMKE